MGDLDGDGVPEIYGGDYGDNAGGQGSGKAYVWSGIDGERLFTLDDGAAGDGCGCGRRAGDDDQDGVPDVAVGCARRSRNAATDWKTTASAMSARIVAAINAPSCPLTTLQSEIESNTITPTDSGV